MPGMRPACLTPVSGTSGSDGAMPQVTSAESESLQCKKAAMHHRRHKWHSQDTGQIVATCCVAQDHSCTLDSHLLLLRTRADHALAAERDGGYQEQLQKIVTGCWGQGGPGGLAYPCAAEPLCRTCPRPVAPASVKREAPYNVWATL